MKKATEFFKKRGTFIGQEKQNIFSDFFIKKYSDQEITDENRAAIKSLTNWLTKKLPTPKYISGPVSFTKHTRIKNGETFYVYVIGDDHGLSGNCADWNDDLQRNNLGSPYDLLQENHFTIDDFLQDVVEKSPVFLDVFLEEPFEGWDSKSAIDCFLSRTCNRLDVYLPTRDRGRIVEQDNVRIHAIDIRNRDVSGLNQFCGHGQIQQALTNPNFGPEDLPHGFLDIVTKIAQLGEKFVFPEIVGDTSYDRNTKIIEDFIKTYVISEGTKVKKDYEKLLPYHQHKIIETITMNQRIRNLIIDFIRSSIYNLQGYNNDVYGIDDLYIDICNSSFYINALAMDIYTISRMFKRFKEGGGIVFPHNSIIYVGDDHAENCRDFLSSFEFSKTILHDRSNRLINCQNIKSIDVDLDNYDGDRDDAGNCLNVYPKRCIKIKENLAYPMFGVNLNPKL